MRQPIRRLSTGVIVCLVGLGLGLGGPSPTRASGGITYFVALGGTGDCTTGRSSSTPLGSIGSALACAQLDSPPTSTPDTIAIAPGTYAEHSLQVNVNVTLAGIQGQTTVDGRNADSVFSINCCVVRLSGLTIQHGATTLSGGGIFHASGTVRLDHSTVTSNTASSGAGGGIFNASGTVRLDHSTVSRNTATSGAGGGILNTSGTLTLDHSTVSRNTATSGGGIVTDGGTVTLDQSAIAGNVAEFVGGGIWNVFGTVRLDQSAVTGNTATSGGGIDNDRGRVELDQSIVMLNTPNNCAPAGSVPGCSN